MALTLSVPMTLISDIKCGSDSVIVLQIDVPYGGTYRAGYQHISKLNRAKPDGCAVVMCITGDINDTRLGDKTNRAGFRWPGSRPRIGGVRQLDDRRKVPPVYHYQTIINDRLREFWCGKMIYL